MNIERDKFLANAMGYLWHDCQDNPDGFWCHQCAENYPHSEDFSTWEGFGELWNWSIKQPWWGLNADEWTIDIVQQWIINPDKFADVIYQHLKWLKMLDKNK